MTKMNGGPSQEVLNALTEIGSKGIEAELEQQLLFFSRRCRHLTGEIAKGNAILASKDAEIDRLTKELTQPFADREDSEAEKRSIA